MTLYARVERPYPSVVMELFTPPDGATIAECFVAAIAVQFLAVPDGVGVAPGWIYNGSSFEPPGSTSPTAAQMAMLALAEGVHIVSAATPAISGIYPLDQASQWKNLSIGTYIVAFSSFPGGASTYSRPDIGGTLHVFPSTAVYMAWLQAYGDYVASLDAMLDTNSGSLPAQPKNIA